MKKKTEKAYFNELWDQMTVDLQDFLKTADQEKLHHFRVQIKKLRALFTLLEATGSKNKLSKQFKPVKRIFRQGGIIREAYINLQLSTQYGLSSEQFMQDQVNDMELGIKQFMEFGKKNLKTVKSTHEDIEKDLEATDDEQVREFYKDQLAQVAAVLAAIKFNEELHDCRKKIKILIYNRKIADKALGSLHLNIEYLDKLQGCLGDWHDAVMAIELFSAPEINAGSVVARIKRQNTKLRKSIKELAADFWEKVILPDEVAENMTAPTV
jgi:CHAD domain-containing protein